MPNMKEAVGLDSRLRKLVGEATWNQLKKSGGADMNKLSYVCRCDTCKIVFYNEPLSAVHRQIIEGRWNVERPQLWYIKAARHWIPQKFHGIRVTVEDGADKTVVKDLSQEWLALAKQFEKQHVKITLDKALTAELDDMEHKAKF